MPTYPKRITLKHISRAIDELAIDRPIYAHRIVGNRLEMLVYGADEPLFWPPEQPAAEPAAAPATEPATDPATEPAGEGDE